ncbi:monosaccharide ABC transporter substrate-binding protein, CUT2 family [Rubellimicrobium thermophilum DSM 16684]|uniref:Monosaccharide ABC transporter substrate-binding protein, CUT2 family n=1 Tax=Rubellimicrobium thermophilum DSM 16684 TaxID=1123069 RepID=S9QTY4_9RHOB|nr:ABC transporter substrate-binding protein [Rubellimicrobium thermophilum]EPX84846.1 monosaccharide ABC transporter substrate-binding protein, CUT2 family [Rubellimicrobium thermophilum DSM 16684]
MTEFHRGVALAALLSGLGGMAAAQEMYTIGISNTVQGNGWREEMICAMKAQALDSGMVESLNIAHRNTDAAGQSEDIRNLIQAGVDAIVVNPASPDGINDAIREATEAGIVVVAVDQAVTEPSAYVISNNQEEYAYLGAKWLFEQLGGEGDVVYMRGAAGASADDDRHRGFQRALEEYPGINVVHEVFTGWQQDQGKQQILDFIASGIPFDGIWTSGIDNVIVDALIESGSELVPVVGADNAGFVGQLASVEGLTGAAVTNPGSIGGAGVTLALQILQGQAPAERIVLVEPEVWDNVTEEGRARIAAAQNPDLDPEWPVSVSIPGWTTYDMDEIIACRGPGE